jgi:16S rRNA (cytidine1402-2'-O)-methyltransferase
MSILGRSCYTSSVLSVVSTPIGNLKDITIRAKEALEGCNGIICEDTRVTGHLLSLLQLPKKELISFHGYTDSGKADWILDRLKKGEHLCLVSDAGTPGISDPGYVIISRVRDAGLPIETVPGASAFLAALSISGLPMNQFTYLGFLPLKKGRKTLLETLKEEKRTIVFYESPHRIEKTLSELAEVLAGQPERKIVVARELTKLHEEVRSIAVQDIADALKTLTVKGEFVVVLAPIER